MSVSAFEGQQRASDHLELDLQVVVSYSMWVLSTEPGSSAETVNSMHAYSLSHLSIP